MRPFLRAVWAWLLGSYVPSTPSVEDHLAHVKEHYPDLYASSED